VKLILLEDDPLIQLCTQDALELAGYEVLLAGDGSEALQLLANSPDVDLMMVDIRLAGQLDGWEVARRARETHPSMRIVYTTTAESGEYRVRAVENSVLLQKPYTLDRAVHAVQQAVAASA
jgi:DNA-binding response OmpR family regulator